MCLVDEIQRSPVSRYWNTLMHLLAFSRESIAIVCDLPNYLGGTLRLTEARRSPKAIIFSMKYETMRVSVISRQDINKAIAKLSD